MTAYTYIEPRTLKPGNKIRIQLDEANQRPIEGTVTKLATFRKTGKRDCGINGELLVHFTFPWPEPECCWHTRRDPGRVRLVDAFREPINELIPLEERDPA